MSIPIYGLMLGTVLQCKVHKFNLQARHERCREGVFIMTVFDNTPQITNVFSRDYNDEPNYSRTVLEVGDELTGIGENLHISDLTDPCSGIFLNGMMGSLRLSEISENKDSSFTVVIPNWVQSGDYTLEVITVDDDYGPHSAVYPKTLHIKGFAETYGMPESSYWYDRGVKAGRVDMATKLVSWMEDNGFKKPEVRFIKQEPQKKVVVVTRK